MKNTWFEERALQLENEIVSRLEKNNWLIGDDEDKPSTWTKAINNLLVTVAKSVYPNCLIACKDKTVGDSPEWLYDFVCYNENEIVLNDVLFIAESQWMNLWHRDDNYQDVKYDFEKLILARCQVKFMIFEADDENEIKNYVKRLVAIVASSRLTEKGDRYMFIVWDRKQKKFYVELYLNE